MSNSFSCKYRFILLAVVVCGCVSVFAARPAFAQAHTGKLPVIIVPGLTGSELTNSKTKEVVWFNAKRVKADDIRLPISPDLDKDRDDLVPTDILREVKLGLIKIDGYQGLITALKERGGYSEGKWDDPPATGYEDTCYVFYYDWRRDNVESARLLVRKVEELKRKLHRPDLKFNIVAHSMGGIVSRYAAMYGDAELPGGTAAPKPTWVGARDFNKIILMGTPNEGTVPALNSLLNGFALGGIPVNLPFIQNPSKFDIFTLPAAYQLLPAGGSVTAYDENLKPLKIDFFDPRTWALYGWGALEDKNFSKHFSVSEQAGAKAYFAGVLNRAHRLYRAIGAVSSGNVPVSFDIIGGDCKETLDGIVIYRDAKSGVWKTLFKPDGFTRGDGTKVTADELRKIMYAPGDSEVTKRSQTAIGVSLHSASFVCEIHNRQQTNGEIQDKIIALLAGGGLARNVNSRYINVIAN